MNQGEFAAALRRDIQQRHGHSLAPGGRIALHRTRFIQAANDIALSPADGFPALILLELLELIFPQEQQRRFGMSSMANSEVKVLERALVDSILIQDYRGNFNIVFNEQF